MKIYLLKLSFLLLALLAFSTASFAQPGTDGDGFQVVISSPSSIAATYKNEACGYGIAQFGGEILSDLEGDCAWGFTANGDSLACSPIVTDLSGKIAIIRRGTCPFSLKSYHAQLAGAKAVVILNHYNNATEAPCTIFTMTGLDSAAAVTIPAIFLCRQVSEGIQTELDLGNTVHMQFVFPRMYEAAAAYHYATPVSQVDTLGNIGVRYVNRTGATQNNVVVKADILAPNGSVDASLEVDLPVIVAGLDTVIQFPAYLPPAVKGKFTVVYSNNKHVEPRDTVIRHFVHTDYTWATDNLVNDPGGVGPSNADFQTNNFFIQNAGLCFTGDTPGAKATYISFGISNVDSVYVNGGDPGSNDVGVFVYDGDPNSDGAGDFGSTFDEMDQNGQQVAYGVYTMDGTEEDGQMLHVPIQDFNGNPFVELLPNHPYYVSLQYNGILAGSGRSIRFSNSTEEYYYAYTNLPTTPLYFGQMFTGGWSGAIVIQRLQLEGFDPIGIGTSIVYLDENKYKINPNPANDLVNLELNLAANNKAVNVQLLDWTGKTTQVESRKNFQNGTISFDTKSMPSGMYILWISTEEGTIMKKVAVAH